MASHNLNAMMCLNFYLESLGEKDFVKVSAAIRPGTRKMPLISWDLSGNLLSQQHVLHKDLAHVRQFSHDLAWKATLKNILSNPYEALVITNTNQEILWVNEGFTKMTGYASDETLGKTPQFLQGENTSEKVRRRIRKKLDIGKPFIETVINYRKNKEEYSCEIAVFPLKDDSNLITHFLALEREVA